MKLAFAGTPEFARVALQQLHAAGFEIALVLTQPDRPAGRGLKLTATPVKSFALEHGIAVAQPRSLRVDARYPEDAAATRAALLEAQPEVLVVAAYGLILPPAILELPIGGCINIHASLLPRWRGAAPILRAIEAGDRDTGITIMQMDSGLDTGDMLLARSMRIAADDTAVSLQRRLAELGGVLIVDALRSAVLTPRAQPVEGVTYAQKIRRDEAPIDWRRPAPEIERRLRAFDPFPGATGVLGGELIKCWRGAVIAGQGAPGEVLAVGDAGISVACGTAALRLTQLQRAGGRRLGAREFLQRSPIRVGQVFESSMP